MKSRALAVVEPIARVEREQLHLSALGQFCRLVDEQSAVMNARLDGHACEGTIEAAAQQSVGSRHRVAEVSVTRHAARLNTNVRPNTSQGEDR
jgi:hypothetical protein